MAKLIRLYAEAPLEADRLIPLQPAQAHYLHSVMRRAIGEHIEVFNGRDGAFLGTIQSLSRKGAHIQLIEFLSPPDRGRAVTLCFAPVKRGPAELIAQKATELGVQTLQPVRTERTTAKTLKEDRLRAIMIEASEQCERISVPSFEPEMPLSKFLAQLDEPLIFADEEGGCDHEQGNGENFIAKPILRALSDADLGREDNLSILIGPEGGFSPREREILYHEPHILPVSLGEHILRADTAAIVALAVVQLSQF